jgi:hypothetical protein
MDVKSTFLHGDLSKEIFNKHPPGFMIYFNLVCQLKKSLYGLKQAPQAWYDKIKNFFLRIGFKHCESHHGLYALHTNRDTFIAVVNVDDLLIIDNNNYPILRLKKQLVDSLDMIDIGTLHYFFGLQVLPLCDGSSISLSKYVIDILTRFKMDDCNPYATPFQSRVKLTKTCKTPQVDATLYR